MEAILEELLVLVLRAAVSGLGRARTKDVLSKQLDAIDKELDDEQARDFGP